MHRATPTCPTGSARTWCTRLSKTGGSWSATDSSTMTTDRLFVPEVLLEGTNLRADWAVLAHDGRIRAIGPRVELGAAHPGVECEDLPRRLLVPGAVNAHSHSFQSLLRGLGDDQPFTEWRSYLYRHLPTLDEEGVYTGALLAFGEMLLRGTTTVCDFFYLHHGG